MKRRWQRVFAILIGVLMIFSMVALFFPIFNASARVAAPTLETAPAQTTT